MGCPACGGTERVQIAPGYYECRTVVARPGPPPIHPALPVQPVPGICGIRYQEGTGGQAIPCRYCGLYSIGRCQRCGEPVCHDHVGSDRGQPVECVTCRITASQAATQRAAAEEAERRRNLPDLTPQQLVAWICREQVSAITPWYDPIQPVGRLVPIDGVSLASVWCKPTIRAPQYTLTKRPFRSPVYQERGWMILRDDTESWLLQTDGSCEVRGHSPDRLLRLLPASHVYGLDELRKFQAYQYTI